MIYRFGNFELDPDRSTFTRDGHRVRLEPTPFRLLALLLERAPEVVTHEEALRTLWPDGSASEGSVARAVREIRRALRESAAAGGTLRTVRRQGYAIDAAVERRGPRGETEVAGWRRLDPDAPAAGAEPGGSAPGSEPGAAPTRPRPARR